MSSESWQASGGSKKSGITAGMNTTVLVIVVAVLICLSALGVAWMVTREKAPTAPATTWLDDRWNQDAAQRQACFAGGGTWVDATPTLPGDGNCI